jgi:hypothetical protein
MSAIEKQGTVDEGTDVSRRSAGKTVGGKDILIYQTQQGPWKVRFKQGGELPVYLTGRYTKHEYAQADVNKYLKEDKEQAAKKAAAKPRKPRGKAQNAKSKSEG